MENSGQPVNIKYIINQINVTKQKDDQEISYLCTMINNDKHIIRTNISFKESSLFSTIDERKLFLDSKKLIETSFNHSKWLQHIQDCTQISVNIEMKNALLFKV